MLSVQNLQKNFRYHGHSLTAISDLSFTLNAGDTLGVLGPNGAGKTTLLRMLATLSVPSAGTAIVAGHDIRREPRMVRSLIGYVSQSGTLLGESIVGQELVFHGQCCGLSAREARERGRELLASLDAEGLINQPAGKLSGGQRRRVDIALGLLSRPRVLFLDEPTVGLDPDSRRDLWTLLHGLRETYETTIIFSTHYLGEAEALADNILLLENGRKLAHGSPQDITSRYSRDRAAIGLADCFEPANISGLREIPGVSDVTVCHDTAPAGELCVDMNTGNDVLPRVLAALSALDVGVRSVQITSGGLDDAFFTLVGQEVLS